MNLFWDFYIGTIIAIGILALIELATAILSAITGLKD